MVWTLFIMLRVDCACRKKPETSFPGLKPGFGSKTRWFWPMNTSYTHCDEKQTFLVQNLMLNSFLDTKISENTQKTRFHDKTPLSLTSDKIEHAINLLKPHSIRIFSSMNVEFHLENMILKCFHAKK